MRSIGWLSDQPDAFRDWAAEIGQLRRYRAGQYIYQAMDEPDGVYGLRAGAIEVEFPLIGDEQVSLVRWTEGFWIGDSGLLSEQKRMVSVVAVEESSFVFLPAVAIRQLLTERPEYWQSFYDLSHRNVGIAVGLLAEALALTVRGRVCRRLLALSENRQEAHITQESLAKTLGVARPTLRRCLNTLVEFGAIENKYRRVAILNRDVLHRFKDEQ